MIRPMPFWPSFEPCTKLTSVQVRIRIPRIHHGGGWSPFGRRKLGIADHEFQHHEQTPPARTRTAARAAALCRSGGLRPVDSRVPSRPRSSELVMPTPMIEPINVCELEAGRPKNQVPRFQMMAAINSANTMANPALLPTCRINSTGSRETMLNATAPLDRRTPSRLNIPTTPQRYAPASARIDHRGDRIRRIVKAVDELEAERDQQGHEQQDVREKVSPACRSLNVDIDAVGDEQQCRGNDAHEDDAGQRMKATIKIRPLADCGFYRAG